jgi:hypothetical protein
VNTTPVMAVVGHVFTWGGTISYVLYRILGRIPVEKKRAFALRHPRIWGWLDLLVGIFTNIPQAKRGLLTLAAFTHEQALVRVLSLLPDEDESGMVSTPTPLVPIVRTVAPPPPPPLTAIRKSVTSERHSMTGISVPVDLDATAVVPTPVTENPVKGNGNDS